MTKRYLHFYVWLAAVTLMMCNTTTISAFYKADSHSQLKAGNVIKIYPKSSDGTSLYGESKLALACSGDGKELTTYEKAGSGDSWTLVDAGDGYFYLKNNLGYYWAYQGRSFYSKLTCTTSQSSAVKVRIEWNSTYDGFYFENKQDRTELTNMDGKDYRFNWWSYSSDYSTTFDIALDPSTREVMDDNGIVYLVDFYAGTAKVVPKAGGYWRDIVNIPKYVVDGGHSYKVTSLGDNCFKGLTMLSSVTLPDGITSLGDNCFSGCTALRSITLPESITTLGDNCFEGCSKLANITFSGNIISFGDYCFSDCSSLKSIILPDGITSLGSHCFDGCKYLKSIAIPGSIKSLPDYCFNDCWDLKNITLPNGITSLGSHCFEGCTRLKSIAIPESVTSLGSYCFNICTSMQSINIPNRITSLPDNCFRHCHSLENMVLPNNVTSLGNGCFSNCYGLKSVNIPDKITSLPDECFLYCDSLASITLPSSITSLGQSCFKECYMLTNITLPAGITSLPEYCFWGCEKLEEIHICQKGKVVDLSSSNVFEGSSEKVNKDNCVLIVPNNLLSDYKETLVWKDFKKIQSFVAVDAISFPSDPISVVKTRMVKAQATIEPSNADTPKLVWKSANTDIATVDAEGVVTGRKVGKTLVTATTADGSNVSGSVYVKVEPLKVETMTFNEPKVSVIKTNDTSITLTLNSEEVDDKTMLWTSSDESVATVKQNLNASYPLVAIVSAHKVGKTIITATAKDGSGVSAACEVEVTPLKVSDFSLQTKSVVKTIPTKLEVSVAPTLADNTALKWTCLTPDIATTTEDGIVTGLKMGKVKLRAETTDGSNISKSFEIEVVGLPVSTISLPTETISVVKTKKCKIQATVGPQDADNQKINWTSGNTEIVTIDEKGFVTGMKVGKARITATSTDGSGVSATCEVEVTPLLVSDFAAQTMSVVKTIPTMMKIDFTPTEADNQKLKWMSLTPEIASVTEDGMVTGLKMGLAKLKATTTDGSNITKIFEVQVNGLPVSTISLPKESSIIKTEKTKLEYSVFPLASDNQTLKWSSNAPDIVTVDENTGVITAHKVGDAIVTAMATDGSDISASTTIHVTPLKVNHLGITKEITLLRTMTGQIATTIEPELADNKTLKWTSDDANIATVTQEGAVKGVNVGTAHIMATTTDGSDLSAICKVTVSPVGISLSAKTIYLKRGGTFASQKINVLPENYEHKNVSWSSLDDGVASIDGSGVISAVKPGVTIIKYVLDYDSNISSECKVIVYDDNVVCLDGIFYHLDANKKEATVTNVFGGKNTSLEDLRMAQYYSGDIRVPETVSDHGVEYTVKAVGNYAFCYQNELQSFKMPNTVQRVGFSAFRYAENLTEVLLSASLNSIDMYAFGDCGFSHIKLPESLNSIQAGAFINDTHLQEITFPEKLQEVGMAAFENNSALESVTFNTTVGSLSVGNNAFNQCPILNKVYIANLANFAQTNFGNAKANPANVSQHIYDANGKEIINVVLPKGTKYVNNNAFNGCAYIESIEMPATISLVYDNIFYGCSSLRDVCCYATSVPTFKGKQDPADMDDVFHSTTLHVIYGNESAYKADSWWGRFYQVKGCEAPRPDNVKATSIVLDQTQLTMRPDEMMQLEAMVYPEDATNRNVTWSNSNDDVAIVTDDGFVLALAEGKTVVTAKTTDGSNLSASCVITVTEPTGIGGISLGDVKIIVSKRHLVVKGLADHDVIHVVNAIGFTVYRGLEHELNLSAPGMYVVKVKGKTVKINVK